jgi:hypothetical protein
LLGGRNDEITFCALHRCQGCAHWRTWKMENGRDTCWQCRPPVPHGPRARKRPAAAAPGAMAPPAKKIRR